MGPSIALLVREQQSPERDIACSSRTRPICIATTSTLSNTNAQGNIRKNLNESASWKMRRYDYDNTDNHWNVFSCSYYWSILHSCFCNAALVVVALLYKVSKICFIHYAATEDTFPLKSFILIL